MLFLYYSASKGTGSKTKSVGRRFQLLMLALPFTCTSRMKLVPAFSFVIHYGQLTSPVLTTRPVGVIHVLVTHSSDTSTSRLLYDLCALPPGTDPFGILVQGIFSLSFTLIVCGMSNISYAIPTSLNVMPAT